MRRADGHVILPTAGGKGVAPTTSLTAETSLATPRQRRNDVHPAFETDMNTQTMDRGARNGNAAEGGGIPPALAGRLPASPFARMPRDMVEAIAQAAVDELDRRDGDPDLEPDADAEPDPEDMR